MTTNSTTLHPTFLTQAEHLARGCDLLPTVEHLARRLQQAADTQTPLRVKLGLDPTRPDLHLGHSVVLNKLRAFQDLGHQAVLIIGDATAMIGDPSGKNETRPPLTSDEVAANAETYLAQAGTIIDVSKAEIVRNSQWFNAMHLGDFLALAAKATVAQILARDDFSKRYTDGRAIFLHELFYPLMQGYDSVQVNADIELGGTDQRFNNLMGRELQTAYASQPHPQLVLLAPLLEGTDGVVKMSKSYPEHCVNVTDSPEQMFGKLMSVPDIMIGRYNLLLTSLTEEQIAEQAAQMASGQLNPRDAKAHMARAIITQFYDMAAAQAAEAAFVAQFRNKEIPTDIPEVTLAANTAHELLTLMVTHGLAPSKAEAKRLIAGGGVRVEGEKIGSPEATLSYDKDMAVVLQVGKRQFCRLCFR